MFRVVGVRQTIKDKRPLLEEGVTNVVVGPSQVKTGDFMALKLN